MESQNEDQCVHSDVPQEDDGNDIHSDDHESNELLIAQPDVDNRFCDQNSLDLEGERTRSCSTVSSANMPRCSSSTLGASAVIDILGNLMTKKILSGTHGAYLKNKYLALCSYLSDTRDNEFNLLQMSKRFTVKMEQLSDQLAKADSYPENYNTPADVLREQLLNAENQLLCYEERCDDSSYILEGLREEKKMLQREFDRLPKEDEYERLRRQLENTIDEIRTDHNKRLAEARQLTQSYKDVQSAMNAERKLVTSTEEDVHLLRQELDSIGLLPMQYAKEAEKIRKQKQEADVLYNESTTESIGLKEELTELESCRLKLDMECAKLMKQSSKKQRYYFEMATKFDATSSQLDRAQQKAADLALEKAENTMKIEHLISDKKHLSDQLRNSIRERDLIVCQARKSESGLSSMRDAVKFAEKNCRERKAICEANRSLKKDPELEAKRGRLLKEIVQLQEAVISQCGLSDTGKTRLRDMLNSERYMNDELSALQVEVVELSRLVTIKSDEREQKSREFRMAQIRHTRMQDEMKTKQLQIQEYEKSLHGTEKHLRDFADLYNAIKEERNQCLTLIQLAQQRLEEIAEKLRIGSNTVEILTATLKHKNEQITRQRIKFKTAMTNRDKIRNDLSKEVHSTRELEANRKQIGRCIERHDQLIGKNKQWLIDLQCTIRRAIQIRNDRAVQLVERNEEVCILQEKLRLQQETKTKGELELNSTKEQFQWLHQEKKDLERTTAVLKRQNESRREIEKALVDEQIQLSLCQDQVLQLEQDSVNPKAAVRDPETGRALVNLNATKHEQPLMRLRHVQLTDTDPAALRLKLDSVQVQLLQRDRKMLEYGLLIEAINRLICRLQERTGLGRDVTLQLAKKMNEHHTTVNQNVKMLKCNTAELTMLMAMAFKLEREIEERRTELIDGYDRLDRGEDPSEVMRLEWERFWKRAEAKQKMLEMPEADGVEAWTTAPERPNAYVKQKNRSAILPKSVNSVVVPSACPTNKDRPLNPLSAKPVPYGSHAPFRPSEPGANMRHYRKPKLKELEI